MKIGFVTCDSSKMAYYFPTPAEPLFVSTEPPFTPDDQIAVNVLRERGHEVSAVQWGRCVTDLLDYDLIIVRSPWDYMDSTENTSLFFTWIDEVEQAGIKVTNPPRFMRWLLDKHYLADLANQGVAVIPTVYIDINAAIHLPSLFNEKGPFVLKPCISAAGVGLYFIDSEQTAHQCQDRVSQSLAERSYMLQDFVPEIASNGEWSLIFIGGKYSHAVHKMPAANEIMVHAERGGSLNFKLAAPTSVIDFAVHAYEGMLRAYGLVAKSELNQSSVTYLRLDIIETQHGPILLECEGVEPELFFRAKLCSAHAFASSV